MRLCRAIAFAPDGKSVISAGGSRIRVWNVEDSKLVGEMAGFENDVYALLASGESVVAASADRSVRQFKLADRTFDSLAHAAPGMGLVARLARAISPHQHWLLRWNRDRLGFGKWGVW